MIKDGTIEECFLHEGAHVNHDSIVYQMTEWKCARDADKHYISGYAKEHPLRYILQKNYVLTNQIGLQISDYSEDVSETITAWYAWNYKPTTVPESDINTIDALIPNRLNVLSEYFLNQKWAKTNADLIKENNMKEPHVIGR